MEGGQGKTYGVFVGDLDLDVNENDLIQFFSQIGQVVKAKVIRNHSTNISKRYGFVHFSEEAMKEKAIAEMNGQMLKGQIINVRNQHYKETDRCLVKPGTKGEDIYIGNIPREMSKQDLFACAKGWGLPTISDVRVFKNDSGQFCFITFESVHDSKAALEILKDESAGRNLGGRTLLVQGNNQVQNKQNVSSSLNANILRSSNLLGDDGRIHQTLIAMKQLLGGDCCPLDAKQLSLLEKSQRTLYVRNLNPKTTEAALHERFSQYGTLRKVIIVSDKDTKVPMGYGFVEFVDSQACSNAALQDDALMDGQALTLQVSRPPKTIHNIISAAGICDENGLLLPQFNPNHHVQMSQQTYFQCPNTGQLFIGDAQHAAHYIAQGYVHVAMQSQPSQIQQPQQQQTQYTPQQKTYSHQQQNSHQNHSYQQQSYGGQQKGNYQQKQTGKQDHYGGNQGGYQNQPRHEQRNTTKSYEPRGGGRNYRHQQDNRGSGGRNSGSQSRHGGGQRDRFSPY